MIYAEVAVSSRRPQRDPFTYTVPSQFTIAVGDGVFVPFGRQVLQGVVLGLAASTTIASPRPILAKIDDPAQLGAPLLTRAQVALARSIADAYLASLFPAVALFLPPNFERKPVRTLHAVPFIDESALNGLSEREAAGARRGYGQTVGDGGDAANGAAREEPRAYGARTDQA